MKNTGICPYCKESISGVLIEPIDARAPGDSYHGVSYVCPRCHVVLSVALDPLALKADVVSEIRDELGKLDLDD